jgi:radical SAM superfamily enzyme YgiQ (UPF0313 family)
VSNKITFILPWNRRPGFADVEYLTMAPYGPITLLSLTPEDWQIELIDERKNGGIDFERISRDTSLVALTTITATANRAYKIADEFRRLGVKVIMGGSHVSALPEEALSHVDSVAIGEADLMWPEILRDFQAEKLQNIYHCERPDNLDIPPKRDLSLLRIKRAPYFARFLPVKVLYTQTSRGCPINCKFCSVTNFSGKKIRHKSVGFVINEIKQAKEKYGVNLVVFLDDNIVGDRQYAMELFEALKKLHIHWFSQTDVRIAEPDILPLAVESGLVFAFIGIESIDSSVLEKSVSFAKSVWCQKYEDAIAALRESRVAVEGAFVFGFPGQSIKSIEQACQWAICHKLDLAQFKVLTPLPGTEFFEELKNAGRITTQNWDMYDFRRCVFSANGNPGWSSLQELEMGVNLAYSRFYSHGSIRERFNKKNKPFPLSGFLRYLVYASVFRATNADYRQKLINV